MIYFHVILGQKHIDLVRANSPEDAIKKVELMFGPARLYSSTHIYKAIEA